MKVFHVVVCIAFFILFRPMHSCAQTWSIGIILNGINIHLKKPVNPDLYKRTISKNKKWVYNIGAGLRISYYVNQYSGLTVTQVFTPNDCGNKFFGLTHAGIFLSTRYFNQSKHEGILIGGPVIFYRKNWNTIEGYKDDGLMKQTKNKVWQYKFVWHGGFLEYRYHYQNNQAYGVHIMPGIPELVSISGHHTSFIK